MRNSFRTCTIQKISYASFISISNNFFWTLAPRCAFVNKSLHFNFRDSLPDIQV
jgi:hypothetical protein